MSKLIYLSILCLITFTGFGQITVLDAAFNATTPSFTANNAGDMYLSWVETNQYNKVAFYYSKFNGKNFTEKVKVPIIDSASTHAEGMPRLAIKNDGTMLVTFELKKSNPKSRFGADLMYVKSKNGRDWSVPNFINPDRNPANSQSFSKPIRLANGEIGLGWLDENLTGKGRSLKFVKTMPNGGFGPIIVLDEQACQCCRVELQAGQKGEVYVFYRNMDDDDVRDMNYVFSANNGDSFLSPKPVFTDKWVIKGCPHTGPSATLVNGEVYMAWFTGKEGAAGVKVCEVKSGKLLLNLSGRNFSSPQLTSNKKGQTFMCYLEVIKEADNTTSRMVFRNGLDAKSEVKYLTKANENAFNPAIINVKDKTFLAYELENEGVENTKIVWRQVK